MAAKRRQANVYRLKGPGIELTYRSREGKLDVAGDDHLLAHEDLEADATADPEIGLRLTATLLDSSRNGTRVMLTVLLPEVSWAPDAGEDPEDVTGVAIVTDSLRDVVGGPPSVLQRHDDVRFLEGTVSRERHT